MAATQRLHKRVLLRLQQLDMFLVLMNTGSIRVTSDIAGMTPSAISKSLKEIETMMGIELFQRTPAGLKPLPAAEIFSHYARSTVDGFNALCDELDGSATSDKADFGTTGGYAKVLLDEAISATGLDTVWGGVHRQIEDAAALLARLRSGQLDVLVAHVPRKLNRKEFDMLPLGSDTLIAAAHRQHAIFSGQAALSDFPWELPQTGDPIRQRMDLAIEESGARWAASRVEYSLPLISTEVLNGSAILWSAISYVQPLIEQGLLAPIALPFNTPPIQIGALRLAGRKLPPSTMALWRQLTKHAETWNGALGNHQPEAFSAPPTFPEHPETRAGVVHQQASDGTCRHADDRPGAHQIDTVHQPRIEPVIDNETATHRQQIAPGLSGQPALRAGDEGVATVEDKRGRHRAQERHQARDIRPLPQAVDQQ